MNAPSRATVERLATSQGGPHISIYMPTVKAGDQIEQNKIRFKNNLRAARAELDALGHRARFIDDVLQPASALIGNHDFWQHQSEGLALFLNSEGAQTEQLPEAVPERTVVAERFHLKPLLPFATGQVRYYVLALEREGIRMFRAGRHGVQQVALTGSPNSLSEYLQWDDPEAQLQWHTQTGRLTVAGRESMFHGHGAGAEGEIETEQLLRFLTALDDAVYKVLATDEEPLLTVVGGEELIGHYRKVNQYPRLVEGELEYVPSDLDAEDLHRLTWPLVEPHFREREQQARQRYLNVQDADRRAENVKDVLLAARAGSVDLLFVPSDTQLWGSFDPDAGSSEVHDGRQPGDDDLFDLAAIRSLEGGAEVFLVSQEDVPGDGECAAILRFQVPEA